MLLISLQSCYFRISRTLMKSLCGALIGPELPGGMGQDSAHRGAARFSFHLHETCFLLSY